MSTRLITLLTEIERALMANDPTPDGGKWDTLRLINFHQGLARLTLSVRSPEGVTAGRGLILLQHFKLADDTQCVKANLSWKGVEQSAVYSIYSKPEVNWGREASQIAVQWLDGYLAAAEARASSEPPSDVSLISATG